jgi:hypothetical protein
VLCTRFGISDVALAKTCQRAMIPTPERGYWARKEAGKKTRVQPLPERPPAMGDEVQVGGRQEYWYRTWTDDEVLGPLPPPPQFETTLESMRGLISKTVDKVTVPSEVTAWHPAISRLLKDDAKRQEKLRTSVYVVSWDRPQFDSPAARRRLRILNALFVAVGKFRGRPSPDKDAVKISISFYNQNVWIKLAPSKRKGGAGTKRTAEMGEELSLSILNGYNSEREIHSWSADEGAKLESRLGEIAIEIVYQAELAYRLSVERMYDRRKERKAELEKELRHRKLEAERTERIRVEKLQRERLDRLLQEAAAFEQAAVIRKYVEAVRDATAGSADLPVEKVEAWSRWALAEADRVDPSVNGRFLECMKGTDINLGLAHAHSCETTEALVNPSLMFPDHSGVLAPT